MANLSLTLRCNRACSYCFAQSASGIDHEPTRGMSREIFRAALRVLKRSGIEQVRLLGGEPTLHPDFGSFLEEGHAAGFHVLVFSNGLIDEGALCAIEKYPTAEVTVLVNVNAIEEQTAEESAWQAKTFTRLGERVIVGRNIHTARPELTPLLDLLDQYDLRRQVRLGLAHPCGGAENRYLHPKHYELAGGRIAEFILEAKSRDVGVDLDCGFVPCMFPPGFVEQYESQTPVGMRCNPLPDLLPDGVWIPCYPLAQVWGIALTETQQTRDLQETFGQLAAAYRPLGIYPRCSTCEWRQKNRCVGGCLAAAIRRLRPGFTPSKTLHLGETKKVPAAHAARVSDPPSALWHIPYVDHPIEFWAGLKEEFGPYIQRVYVPLPQKFGLGSGRPMLPSKHLAGFLRSSIFPVSILVNPVTLPAPADEVAPRLIQGLKRLSEECPITDITVTNLQIARRIREEFAHVALTASVLMDIATPHQVLALGEVFDVIVPSNRIMRQRASLAALRRAFPGRIRLMVNEACIPGCPLRVQHFHEMCQGLPHPRSLCEPMLRDNPWLRLTGAWVLPQHLHFYDGLYDELKLAGRITLREPARYRQVLGAYIHRRSLRPNEIGGGPASVLNPMDISEEFYAKTLECGLQCHECSLCRDYLGEAAP